MVRARVQNATQLTYGTDTRFSNDRMGMLVNMLGLPPNENRFRTLSRP